MTNLNRITCDESKLEGLPKKSRRELWLEANAKPKVCMLPRKVCEPTRFAKPGPMSMADWFRFYKWLGKSLPRKPKKCGAPKVHHVMQMKQPYPKIQFCKKYKNKQQSLERMNLLAKPKHKREKYEFQSTPEYPFLPTTNYSKTKGPEKNRPYQPVTLPLWWYHEELEMDFWRKVRYPVSENALKYKLSQNVKKLAEPRQYPIEPHCELPQTEEYKMPERIKMKGQQWKDHLRRLVYLSDASYKEKRVEAVLTKMELQCNSCTKLAKPKVFQPKPICA